MNEVTPDQRKLRVAVLSDIHGNIRALNAVLEEVESAHTDGIVVCGDVAAGPFPGETLDRLMGLGERAAFVRGNADREIITAYDSRLQYDPKKEGPAKSFTTWCAGQITRVQRDFMTSFKERHLLEVSGLGEVIFCHGTPRSDEEIMTSLTPEASLDSLLAGVEAKVVVCGHTHHQFDRKTQAHRVINPGSLGMPYQGKPGAFWALLGPDVDFRRTDYDFERAVEEALSSGYPDPEYRETILTPPKPEDVAAFFEKVAVERGERG